MEHAEHHANRHESHRVGFMRKHREWIRGSIAGLIGKTVLTGIAAGALLTVAGVSIPPVAAVALSYPFVLGWQMGKDGKDKKENKKHSSESHH